MKRSILNKLFIALFAITFLSCENAIQQGSGNKITNEEKKTAYVCVKSAGLADASRTALPTFNPQELTNLVLMGYSGGSNQELATADSLDELSSKLIEIEEGKWSFSLAAELNGVEFYGNYSATAVNGQTLSLAFVLETSSVSNKGWFSITVAYEGEADSATGIFYEIDWSGDKKYYYIDNNSVDYVTDEPQETKLTIQQNANGQKYVTFAFPFDSDHAIYTGSYRSEIALYNKGSLLNTYSTSVIVAEGLVSKATAFISLSNSYTITFHNLEDGEFLTAVRGAYTKKDTGTITLPAEIKRVGYKFLGWYDNEDLSGNPVTEFTITTYENKDFWAKWETLDPATFYVSAGGTGDGSSATNALGSLQAAANKIINLCDPDDDSYDPNAINTRYIIKVAGMLSGSQTLSGSFNVGSLTIEGANGLNGEGVPQDSIPSGCAITIEETPVTLKNISISNTNDVALCVGSQQNNTETEVMLDSGTLICNTMNSNSTIDGGGINIAPQATVTMKSGSKITNTHATNGAGVCVSQYATFKMAGGEISGNGGQDGVGVYVCQYGTFEMTGGKISDNTAMGDGGGILSYGTSALSSGEISNNTATNGGGIFNTNYGLFTLTGGEISDNTASFGSGVYNRGTFELSEDAQIDSSNDVYLTYSTELVIAGPLNKSAVATITPLSYEENSNNKMLELKEVGFNSLSGQTYYITTTSIAAEASKFSITTQTTDEDGDPLKQPRNWQLQSDSTIFTSDPYVTDYKRLLLGSQLNSSNLSTTKASLETGKQYKFVLDEYYASSLTNLMSLLKPASSDPVIFGESIINLSKNETISYTESNYYDGSGAATFANNITKIVLPKNVSVNRDPQANMFRDVQAYLKEIVITPGNDPSVLTLSDGALLLEINGGGYGVEMSLYCYPSQREGTSYTIPQGITYLYDSAFYKNANLTTINGLNRITKIGGSIFEDSQNIKDVDLSGVTEFQIKGYNSRQTTSPCLFKNSKVEKITLPNTSFVIGEDWFTNCSELKEITFLSSTPPELDKEGVYNSQTDERYSINHFYQSNLLNLVLKVPTGAIQAYISDTSTNSNTFGFAHKKNTLFSTGYLYITDGVDIATGPYRLKDATPNITEEGKTIIVCGNNPQSNWRYNWTDKINEALNEATVAINIDCSILDDATTLDNKIAGNTKLAGISLPQYVGTIAEEAFKNCTSLTTIDMPAYTTTIGAGAFSGCTSLTTVKIDGAEVTDVTGWKDDTDTQIVLADGQTFAQYLQTCTTELKKN